jgi:hypothetical protein
MRRLTFVACLHLLGWLALAAAVGYLCWQLPQHFLP